MVRCTLLGPIVARLFLKNGHKKITMRVIKPWNRALRDCWIAVFGAIQNSPGQGSEQSNFEVSSALRTMLDFRAPSNLNYCIILYYRVNVPGQPTRHKVGHLVWLRKRYSTEQHW